MILGVLLIDNEKTPLKIIFGSQLDQTILSSKSHMFGVYDTEDCMFKTLEASELIPLRHAFVISK